MRCDEYITQGADLVSPQLIAFMLILVSLETLVYMRDMWHGESA